MVRLSSLCFVCAILLVAGACHDDVVRLANLKFAHYGAVSFMQQHCRKFGVSVQETIFPKGIDIFPAVMRGEVDLAASAADAAIANRAAGAPAFIVAGFAKGGARIVGRSDLELKAVSDLKGRKVGVTRGGAQELLLLVELASAGLSWSDQPGKDVQIVYLPFADLNQALLQKQLDAICQSEPQSSQAINKGFGTEILKPYDTPLGEPVRVLMMSERLYHQKPALALKIVECFVDATKTFQQDAETAERYVRDTMFKGQISHQDFVDAMSNASFTYDVTVEHIQTTTDLMTKYGVGKLKDPPKASDWVKLDLLAKAKAKLGVQ